MSPTFIIFTLSFHITVMFCGIVRRLLTIEGVRLTDIPRLSLHKSFYFLPCCNLLCVLYNFFEFPHSHSHSLSVYLTMLRKTQRKVNSSFRRGNCPEWRYGTYFCLYLCSYICLQTFKWRRNTSWIWNIVLNEPTYNLRRYEENLEKREKYINMKNEETPSHVICNLLC